MGPQQGLAVSWTGRDDSTYSLPHTLSRNSSLFSLLLLTSLGGPKGKSTTPYLWSNGDPAPSSPPSRGRKKPRARTSLDVVNSVDTQCPTFHSLLQPSHPQRFLNNQGIRSREVLWRLVSSSEVSYSSSQILTKHSTEGQAPHPL